MYTLLCVPQQLVVKIIVTEKLPSSVHLEIREFKRNLVVIEDLA
jgi:hypothetical protein